MPLERAKRNLTVVRVAGGTLLGLYGLTPAPARGVDVVSFSASDVGSTHAVGQWGTDFGNAQIDSATMGSSLAFLGEAFDLNDPLNANGTLSTAQIASANATIADLGSYSRKLTIAMGPTVSGNDPSYSSNGSANVAQWAAAMTAFKNYYQSQGYSVSWAGPFTEPDYWTDEGTPAQNAQIMQLLRADPAWAGTQLQGGVPLNAADAQAWYSPLVGITNAGSSHLLGGSLSDYDSFASGVVSSGGQFVAPEMHSLGEAIVTANYNAPMAAWWQTELLARGTFSQASSGKRLGYSVNFNQETAAAVYRGTDGFTYAFAGGLERSGGPDTFRFVSDRPVYVNGIGPITSYTMQADSDVDSAVTSNEAGSFGQYFDQGAMAKIEYGAATTPALDGYRWEIQNVQTGQLLSVAGGATGDNALVNTATANGSSSQTWDITRIQDGYLTLFNTLSGRVLAVNGASQNVGGSFIQYDSVASLDQQLYLAPAGNGTFYIQDGNSAYYLTGSGTNCTQQPLAAGTAAAGQQWRFIPANPTRAAKASYAFNGSANDTTGNYNAAVTGTAGYTAGPTAGSQALVFDGSTTYLTLPSAVSNTSAGIAANYSSGITVDTWVKWNGGSAWQRIFDFGTGTNAYMFLTPSSGDGTMRFGITSAGPGEEEDVDTTALQTGQWVNVAVTLGGHSAVIYVNGRPSAAGSVLINPTYVNATSDYIGKSQFASDPLFNGSLSGFQIFDYALTQSQIDDLVNNNLVWVGSLNANAWDASATANFKLAASGSSSVFTQGDRVTFDGAGTSPVAITGTVSPFSVTVTGSSNITFSGSGSIAGPQTLLTMSGTGTLTIANTGGNSYTGDTTISSGTVSIAADNALGADTSNLNLTGGTLRTTSTTAMVFGHSIMVTPAGGSMQIVGNGPATTGQGDRVILLGSNMLLGGGTLTVTGNGTLAGAAPNTTAAGAGALVLDGTNGFTGTVALQSGGLLECAAANAIDSSATVILGNEAELTSSNGYAVASAVTVAGGTNSCLSFTNVAGTFAGPITVNANLTVGLRNWYNYASVVNGTITGAISGSANLTVNSGTAGGGVLTLTGASTFTGNLIISASTVDAGNDVNIAGRTSSSLGNPSVSGRTVTINSGAALVMTLGNILGTGAQSATPGLSFIVNAGGTLQTAAADIGIGGGGDANIFGNVTLNGGTFTAGNGADPAYQSVILLGSVTTGGTAASLINTDATNATANGIMLGPTGGVTFNVGKTGASGPDLIVSDRLVDSNAGTAGLLIKTGSGTMQLTAANTYTGQTIVSAGTLNLTGSLAGAQINVAAGATFSAGGSPNDGLLTTARLIAQGAINLAGSPAVPGRPSPAAVASIAVGPAGSLTVDAAPNHASRTVLVAGALSVAPGGRIDLTDNDAEISGTGLTAATALIAAAYNLPGGAAWSGPGITSSWAAADSAHLTALGVIQNNQSGSAIYTAANPFDGVTPGVGDVLIKYTYYGDANLDGKVDGSDYTLIDDGYASHGTLTGWYYGDFNYDGVIDGSDYALIDNAFNNQGVNLSTAAVEATDTAQAAGLPPTAVPEPCGLSGALMLVARTVRRKRGLR